MEHAWDVIVIGAGVAGLTSAALLAAEGARVLVLERHTLVGGCASFFQRQGYRFDVGATVAGGFGARGIHRRLFAHLGTSLPATRLEPAMHVHLPGTTIVRWGDERWIAERRRHFGVESEPFWQQQERIADAAWRLALHTPAVPHDLLGIRTTLQAVSVRDIPLLLRCLGRSLASIVPTDRLLRRFIDAQLLITAQASAAATDLVYGATALDLAREGVFHLPDGIATIATTLARAVQHRGGKIRYRSEVVAITLDQREHANGVVLHDGTRYEARQIISALPIRETLACLPASTNLTLRRRVAQRQSGWGAFTAYVGLPAGTVPDDFPLHHQIIDDIEGPLGEGRSLFLSFSAMHEQRRARNGGRAVTISTHTDPRRWQRAYADGTYETERAALGERLLAGLERILPGSRACADLIEFATPHTFARYTGHTDGAVGGYPQRPWQAHLTAFSHRSGIAGLALCGDTVFPGQSTVGVSLSGIIAARACGARVKLDTSSV